MRSERLNRCRQPDRYDGPASFKSGFTDIDQTVREGELCKGSASAEGTGPYDTERTGKNNRLKGTAGIERGVVDQRKTGGKGKTDQTGTTVERVASDAGDTVGKIDPY